MSSGESLANIYCDAWFESQQKLGAAERERDQFAREILEARAERDAAYYQLVEVRMEHRNNSQRVIISALVEMIQRLQP